MELLMIGGNNLFMDLRHPSVTTMHRVSTAGEAEPFFASHSVDFCLIAEELASAAALCAAEGIPYALFGDAPTADSLINAMNQGCCGYYRLSDGDGTRNALIDRLAALAAEQQQRRLFQSVAEEVFWTDVIHYKMPSSRDALLAEAERFGIVLEGPIQPLYIR